MSKDKKPGGLHCAVVTLGDHPWRNMLVRLKYALMKLQRVIYPDSYFIPVWLGGSVQFVASGEKINKDAYDFIFTELNPGEGRLKDIADLLDPAPGKIVIIGPSTEVFTAYATEEACRLARDILRRAGHVWAYSGKAAAFLNNLAQAEVAKVIPWHFDYETTRRLGRKRQEKSDSPIRVLLGVPLRFVGIAQNEPHFLEDCLAQVLAEMSPSERRRFRFLGMVYTSEDELAWRRTGFGRNIGAILEPRKIYTRFVRFMGRCDAVITLPRFAVLGRIAFISAALGKPGVFTDNVELHQVLYPGSLVSSSTDMQLLSRLRELLSALLGRGRLERFLPDSLAAQEVGNSQGNAAKVRQILFS